MSLIHADSTKSANFSTLFKYWRWLFAFYVIYFTAIAIPFYPDFLGKYAYLWMACQILAAFILIIYDGIGLVVGASVLLICNNIELLAHGEVISPEAPLLNSIYAALIFWKLSKDRESSLFPRDLLFFLYCAVAISHFTAGISKFFYNDLAWIDGTALENILKTSPWIRIDITNWFLALVPAKVIHALSYWSTLVELLGFAVFFKRFRRIWIWSALLMHTGVLILLNISQVSLGVILTLVLVLIADTEEEDVYEK